MVRKAPLAVLATLALVGCAHQATLTPQDGVGPIGHGSAPAQLISFHGPLRIDLGGRHYEGEYTLQSSGGFIGSGVAVQGSHIATGTIYGAGTGSNGKAYLTEPSGGSLACEFSYNSMSASGIGACRTEAGKMYDLQIH